MSKLTLHVEADLVAAAKLEAAARQTSLSKLVSNYLRALAIPQTILLQLATC